uniref:Uncharacterized protein n=1 Tax=Rhizophora mucronata TaxID=61149 RepID=A0A2P2KPH1_RHIMU
MQVYLKSKFEWCIASCILSDISIGSISTIIASIFPLRFSFPT